VYVPALECPHSTLIFNLEVKVIREGMYTFSNASFVERGIAIDVLKSVKMDELFVLRQA
jgi:hypothetical protein